jgi:DNA polymerase-3 subunit epsilon
VTLDFTAIDFETANSHRASVCSVGMVKVRDGQVVGQSGGLVRPGPGHDHFDGFNTAIHGITAEMVAKAPPWRRVARWIAHYVGTDLLVAHNAAFDVGVLRDACTAGSIPWPRLDFLCTMLLARRALRLPSYRLPFVAAECGVEPGRYHEALSDARACAQIAVALAQKQGAGTLRELAAALDIRAGRLEEGQYVPGARRDVKGGRAGRPRPLSALSFHGCPGASRWPAVPASAENRACGRGGRRGTRARLMRAVR